MLHYLSQNIFRRTVFLCSNTSTSEVQRDTTKILPVLPTIPAVFRATIKYTLFLVVLTCRTVHYELRNGVEEEGHCIF
jgi:hypothetical protein